MSGSDFSSQVRRRILPLCGALIATGLGLLVRFVPRYGFGPKYGGVALWATALYMAVLTVAPGWRPRRVLPLTIAIGWGIEFLQMTPLPRYLSSKHILLRLLVGEQFNPPDLAALVAGGLLGAATHVLTLRWRSGVRTRRVTG